MLTDFKYDGWSSNNLWGEIINRASWTERDMKTALAKKDLTKAMAMLKEYEDRHHAIMKALWKSLGS